MEKKNKILTVIAIVLGVMVIGLVGYLIYDNFINEESIKEENKSDNSQNCKENDTITNNCDCKDHNYIGESIYRLLLSREPQYFNFIDNKIVEMCGIYIEKIENQIYAVGLFVDDNSYKMLDIRGYDGNGKIKKSKLTFNFDDEVKSIRLASGTGVCAGLYILTEKGNVYFVNDQAINFENEKVQSELIATNVETISIGYINRTELSIMENFHDYYVEELIILSKDKKYYTYYEPNWIEVDIKKLKENLPESYRR